MIITNITIKSASIIFVILSLLVVISAPVDSGSNTAVQYVTVLAPPGVTVELTPDDDPVTPGVQVINPDSSTNKTVNITATVSDGDGYSNIVSVIANITGPSVVEDSPVSLSFDSVVNMTTTAVYTGSFNMSNHSEGDYKVEVRATDFGGLTGVGSRNFTYSYGEPVVTVTTYDFATGAGVDKWAFRYQIYPKSPDTNDVPATEFVGTPPDRKGEYTMISKDDHKMQKDSSNSSGNYTAHRFVFNISESAESIVEIDVQWIGKGVTRDRGQDHGATLYIWNNTNTNTGYYEQLDMTSIRRRETLSGNITANTGDYIDAYGNLTILVVQNANQSARRGRQLVSKLSTDYVKIDVTHLSQSGESASTSEEIGNSWLDRVQQGGVALFRWLLGG